MSADELFSYLEAARAFKRKEQAEFLSALPYANLSQFKNGGKLWNKEVTSIYRQIDVTLGRYHQQNPDKEHKSGVVNKGKRGSKKVTNGKR